MFGLGFQEMILISVLGVLLFGRKLPDIARSLGKSVTEFKKGVNGLEEEFHGGTSSSRPAIEPEAVKPPTRVTPSAPVFTDAPPAPAGDLPAKL
jgi:sec-independent protein translocase protein TatA